MAEQNFDTAARAAEEQSPALRLLAAAFLTVAR
jgi:hypothetical protein